MIPNITREAIGGTLTAVLCLCTPALAGDGATVHVLDGTPGATALSVTLDDFSTKPVDIRGVEHLSLNVDGVGSFRDAGQPDLPRLTSAVVIPDQSAVRAEVVNSRYHDIPDVFITPSRGPIPRTQDQSTVPYAFGSTYTEDGFWPKELVSLREPFVLRDVRGVVAEVNLFQYNPVTHVLRVHDSIEFRVVDAGPAVSNPYDRNGAPDHRDRTFQRMQAGLFVNYTPPGHAPSYPDGDLLIVCRSNYSTALQPLVDWKNSRGIDTTCVDVDTIGNNTTAIKAFIKNEYDTGNLVYVLLVGDSAHITSPSYAGGKSDPSYSLMDADWYPDILVGRFSAGTVAEVDTQVQRTIEYEQQDHSLSGDAWNRGGLGIASNQGPGHNGEYDDEHMDLIRDGLLAYGFTTVDQVYDPSGTKAQISNALNQGRRMVNYCGHGSATSWGTTGFNNNDVNNLTNVGVLPFISSVACVNGEYDNGTCFGEAWLRATDGGQPTGAVGAYMSTIDQYWSEPMWAQHESADMFCAEAEWTMGGLWFAGSAYMMNVCGQSGRDMFMTWTIFGDPSLAILGGDPCTDPTAYCVGAPNSTGQGAAIGYAGSTSLSANDLVLTASSCPSQEFGLFFFGDGQTQVPLGDGNLCVSGSLTRLLVVQTDMAGDVSFTIDYASLPPGGGQVTAGSTWNFQFWYRDPVAGGSGSNLTDALEATFCH